MSGIRTYQDAETLTQAASEHFVTVARAARRLLETG